MDELAIRVRGLQKSYGPVHAVRGLDLDVLPGECFGLLGPNGAGKTTTIEILEGLTARTAGEVTVLGRTWEEDARELRDRLGIQLQETQLYDRFSVGETLATFRSFYRRGLGVTEALERVGLVEKRDAWIKTLSGGQKQRVAIACAIVGDPELVFLDEPTTGLDPAARRSVWRIVEGLKRRGRTIVLTTHYMEEAERLCDRVAIVERGRVIALGTPKELIRRLGGEEVVHAEWTGDVKTEALAALPSVARVDSESHGARLTVGGVHDALPALLRLLESSGARLERLQTRHATLDDVFLALTGSTLAEADVAAAPGGAEAA